MTTTEKTKADIENLALHDPLVDAVLNHYNNNQFSTYETMLIQLVFILSKKLTDTREQLKEQVQQSKPPSIVINYSNLSEQEKADIKNMIENIKPGHIEDHKI
jgi:spore coat protein CotF